MASVSKRWVMPPRLLAGDRLQPGTRPGAARPPRRRRRAAARGRRRAAMTSRDGAPVDAGSRPSPRFWARLPVAVGNVVQVAGIVGGVLLILLAGAIRHMTAL